MPMQRSWARVRVWRAELQSQRDAGLVRLSELRDVEARLADAEASLRRLELMLGSANERLSWRILHPVQAVANQLALMPTDPQIQRAVRQLDFVSCMLRAHESFSSSETRFRSSNGMRRKVVFATISRRPPTGMMFTSQD